MDERIYRKRRIRRNCRGQDSIFKKQDTVIQRTSVADTEAEKARVEAAKTAASEQLQAIYEKALKEVGETNARSLRFT